MADSVEEAYFDWLKTNTAITSLASVYWQEAPAGTSQPTIVMWVVDDPNLKRFVGVSEQGAARIQHDIWVENIALSVKIRTLLRKAVDDMQVTSGGYIMHCESVTELTIPRPEATEPYHGVVDAVIRWRK